MSNDQVSLDEAMKASGKSAEDLKKDISRGELKANRAGADITFSRDELDRYLRASGAIKDEVLFDDANDTSDDGAKTVDLGGKGKTVPAPSKPTPAAKPMARPAAKPATAPAAKRPNTASARATAPAADPVEADSGIGTGMVVGSLATAVIMLLASLVVLDIGRDGSSSLTDGIATFCLEKFGKK